MNFNNVALLFLFVIFGNSAVAQKIIAEGSVIDDQSHQPVPFATLGFKGKNIGTVADDNGRFRISFDDSLIEPNEAIIISSVGYNTISIPIVKFKNGKQEISLTPLSTTLKVVTIKPNLYKTKVFGRTGNSTIMTANMFTERDLTNDNLGKEQAAILSIDKHCYLRDFNMLVVFNRFQSVKFRLNLYSVKDGQPDELIFNKDILFDVTQKNGWKKVDLTPYDIYLDGYKEIAVAIQWVKSIKIDTVARSAFGVSVTPVPFHAMYFRNKSQANWKKISPAYAAFNITADSFKPGREKDTKEETTEPEASPVISDSIRNYAAYVGFSQEAVASGYGSNSKVGKFLHLSDAKLYYEVYGSGEPLLLLHGNSASISSFYKQIPELAKRYQVIAVDTRAQGKSTDESKTPLSYDKFALDIKDLLDSLYIKKVSIVGWSDGGNTGLILAAKYPAYVKSLITMGAVSSPQGVEADLLNQFKETLNKTQKGGIEGSTQQRLLTLMLDEPHITDAELENIKVPVLVIAGEKDVVKVEHTKHIADRIKNAQLLIIKSATHYAPQEKPEAFNQAISTFLK